MDDFLLHSAKIVSTPTEESGSWIHIFSPQSLNQKEKLDKRGQLLAVISLNNFRTEGEIAVVGKEIISRLQEEYYGDLSESAFKHLQTSVNKVVAETKEESFLLSIGAVVILGGVLYAVVNDGGKLIIHRQGEISPILSEKDVLSGYLQPGDNFLLGSSDFFRLVDEGNLKNALRSSPQEGVEILAPLVHEQQTGGAAAVIFRVFQKPKEEEKELSSSEVVNVSKKTSSFSVLFSSIKDKVFSCLELGMRQIKKRAIYLKTNKEKSFRSQKNLMSLALILLALLAVSVFFGMRQREKLGLDKEAQVLFKQAQMKKEEGEALLNLNLAKSRQLLLESKDLIDQMNKDLKNQQFLQFKEELEKVLSEILQEHEVTGKPLFDLEIIKAEAFGNRLSFLSDRLIILDKKQNSVYSLGMQGEGSVILAGGEKLKEASLLTVAGEKVYILGKEGILKAGKTSELLLEKDSQWSTILDMKGFANNLYLLDAQGEIWKYPFLETEFGSKQRWLKEAVDLDKALSMTIDGSVWVLLSDGNILRFTQGSLNYFKITGLEKDFSNASLIYTDFDAQNLYILDKGNSRVVVIDKSGEYKAGYHWSEISQANDLLVLEDEGEIFLLMGSKVFTLNL